MQMNEPLLPKCPEHRAHMEIIRRQAVLASTLNTSGVLDFLPVMVLLLNEQRDLSTMFYAGVAILLGAVLLHPLLGRPRRVEHTELLAVAQARHITD